MAVEGYGMNRAKKPKPKPKGLLDKSTNVRTSRPKGLVDRSTNVRPSRPVARDTARAAAAKKRGSEGPKRSVPRKKK